MIRRLQALARHSSRNSLGWGRSLQGLRGRNIWSNPSQGHTCTNRRGHPQRSSKSVIPHVSSTFIRKTFNGSLVSPLYDLDCLAQCCIPWSRIPSAARCPGTRRWHHWGSSARCSCRTRLPRRQGWRRAAQMRQPRWIAWLEDCVLSLCWRDSFISWMLGKMLKKGWFMIMWCLIELRGGKRCLVKLIEVMASLFFWHFQRDTMHYFKSDIWLP